MSAMAAPDCASLATLNGTYSLFDEQGQPFSQNSTLKLYANGCQLVGLGGEYDLMYFDAPNTLNEGKVVSAEILKSANPNTALEFRVQLQQIETKQVLSRTLFRLLISNDLIIVTDVYDKKGTLLKHVTVIGKKQP